MSEPQPHETPQPERPAPSEREVYRPYSPEAARMIMFVTAKELIHPGNKLTDAQRQQFKSEIRGKSESDLPTKAIADISGESRNQDHDTYGNWSAKMKSWYDRKDEASKDTIKGAFTAFGITLTNQIEQAQIDQFFDQYLDMEGTPDRYQNRYESFVKDFVKDLLNDNGKLDRKALTKRIEVMKPLLISFGQKDIVSVIEAHIYAHGFVSQEEETKNSQAEVVLSGAEKPVTDTDSIKGFKKLAEKIGARVIPQDQPEAPLPGLQPEAETRGENDGDEEEHSFEEIAAGKSIRNEKGENDLREDRLLFAPQDNAFGVFDGVGSEDDSDKGAQICRDYLAEAVKHIPDNLSLEDTIAYLEREIVLLNQIVRLEPGGSSTLTFSYVWAGPHGEKRLINLNAGDSRLYLLRGGQLKQISLDDQPEIKNRTEAEQRRIQDVLSEVDTGEDYKALSDTDKIKFQNRNYVSQVMGDNSLNAVNPMLSVTEIQDDDVFLLSSDGIHDNLTNTQIQIILTQATNPVSAAEELTKQAKLKARARQSIRSKPDDMTALVLTHLDKLPARNPAAPADSVANPQGVYAKYAKERENYPVLQQAERVIGRKLTPIELTYVMFTEDAETIQTTNVDNFYATMKRARDNRLEKERFDFITARLTELSSQPNGATTQEYQNLLKNLNEAQFDLGSVDEIRVFGILAGMHINELMPFFQAYEQADEKKSADNRVIIRITYRKNENGVTLPYPGVYEIPKN